MQDEWVLTLRTSRPIVLCQVPNKQQHHAFAPRFVRPDGIKPERSQRPIRQKLNQLSVVDTALREVVWQHRHAEIPRRECVQRINAVDPQMRDTRDLLHSLIGCGKGNGILALLISDLVPAFEILGTVW